MRLCNSLWGIEVFEIVREAEPFGAEPIMLLWLAAVIEKPHRVETRGQPLGPLRRLPRKTPSVSRIVCRGAGVVIGDARPEISFIIEDMMP